MPVTVTKDLWWMAPSVMVRLYPASDMQCWFNIVIIVCYNIHNVNIAFWSSDQHIALAWQCCINMKIVCYYTERVLSQRECRFLDNTTKWKYYFTDFVVCWIFFAFIGWICCECLFSYLLWKSLLKWRILYVGKLSEFNIYMVVSDF